MSGMTPAECEAHGGHCWTDPPDATTPSLQRQVCRHCPATRHFTWDGHRWNVEYQEPT